MRCGQRLWGSALWSLLLFDTLLSALCLPPQVVFQEAVTDDLLRRKDVAFAKLLANVSPNGTAKGCVIASPSRENPDYYYFWVRDAAIVYKVIINDFINGNFSQNATIHDYVLLSRKLQHTPSPCNCLGEPKFNVDGSAFTGSWGRPQNDGPAIRASALTAYANHYLDTTLDTFYVRSFLYGGQYPARTVIKTDLEYIAQHWRDANFDLWEEVYGHHFFTMLVQRRALVEGAALARRLNDEGAASYYDRVASTITDVLRGFWNGRYINVSRNMSGGVDYKHSGLDVAVLLGALHGYAGDDVFGSHSDEILATALELEHVFAALYTININANKGIAIGRYPEDVYDGHGFSMGNPWPLATATYAELYSRARIEWDKVGYINVTAISLPFFQQFIPSLSQPVIIDKGTSDYNRIQSGIQVRVQQTFSRIIFHTPQDGSMSEQWNRYSGYQQGARDLTWSYASFVTAILASRGKPTF